MMGGIPVERTIDAEPMPELTCSSSHFVYSTCESGELSRTGIINTTMKQDA
jgi:hypothetical protein